jgi:hypothetical protein
MKLSEIYKLYSALKNIWQFICEYWIYGALIIVIFVSLYLAFTL